MYARRAHTHTTRAQCHLNDFHLVRSFSFSIFLLVAQLSNWTSAGWCSCIFQRVTCGRNGFARVEDEEEEVEDALERKIKWFFSHWILYSPLPFRHHYFIFFLLWMLHDVYARPTGEQIAESASTRDCVQCAVCNRITYDRKQEEERRKKTTMNCHESDGSLSNFYIYFSIGALSLSVCVRIVVDALAFQFPTPQQLDGLECHFTKLLLCKWLRGRHVALHLRAKLLD